MALLTRISATRIRRHLTLLLTGTVATGCALISVFGGTSHPFGFSHSVHLEEGLDCDECHVDFDSEDEPGMPTFEACMLCHDEIDAEKPPERRIDGFFDGEVYKAQRLSALSDEVKFSHLEHVSEDIECNTCHVGIEESDYVDARIAPRMADCQSCHAEQAVANDCRSCHERLDTDVAPDSHAFLWTKVHGDAARAHNPSTADDCAICHDEASCRDCHAATEPENHNNYFRTRAHGLYARMDRESCSTCHRSDSCDSCHRDTAPMSHTASFTGTLNTHCLGCHLPLQNIECFTCHKSTPEHDMATPKPSWHSPGMDCLQCHGLNVPLPHVDNGDDCNICHR